MVRSDSRKPYSFASPGIYRICVDGYLHENWSERLAGMHIMRGNFKGLAVTELNGQLRDQAELAGVLNTLYELHLRVLLVEYQNE